MGNCRFYPAKWPLGNFPSYNTALDFALVNENDRIISIQRVVLNNSIKFVSTRYGSRNRLLTLALSGAATGYGAYLMKTEKKESVLGAISPLVAVVGGTIFTTNLNCRPLFNLHEVWEWKRP